MTTYMELSVRGPDRLIPIAVVEHDAHTATVRVTASRPGWEKGTICQIPIRTVVKFSGHQHGRFSHHTFNRAIYIKPAL